MNRHLLPNEIDLLVDGEVGFGVAPLRAHVVDCAECRQRVEDGRAIVDLLERVPHVAPSPMFTERVMSRVDVYVPWYVAALDTARRFIPASRPARALVLGMAGSMALVLTLVTAWLLANAGLVALGAELAAERVRDGLLSVVGGVVGVMFGPEAFEGLRAAGPIPVVGAAAGLLALTLGVAVGLRYVAGVASRRRS